MAHSRSVLLVFASFGIVALAGVELVSRHKPALAATHPRCDDVDGDGYGSGCARGPDCNDRDATMHPGSVEVCGDGRDNDCSGAVDDAPSCSTASVVTDARVHVPAGSFPMGSASGPDDERPLHPVTLGGYFIDRYEVTNGRYQRCVEAGACKPPHLTASRSRPSYFGNAIYADFPVVFVEWEQARAFCEHAGGRLPTEAEWEHAAKGAAERTFPWGETRPRCSLANFAGCLGDTDRVGRRIEGASPYGAEDMAGNVWEWTADTYDRLYYAHSPPRDPRGPSQGSLRVTRGGCFMADGDSLRTTCRKPELATAFAPNVGFRCVYPEVSK